MSKNNSFIISKYIVVIVSLISIVLYFFNFIYSDLFNILTIFLILTIFIFYYFNYSHFLVFFIFIFFSFIDILPEFISSTKTTFGVFFYNDILYSKVLFILLVFFFFLLLFFKKPKILILYEKFPNKILNLFSISIMILIILFGIDRSNFSVQVYSNRISTFYEYFVLFFIISFITSKGIINKFLLLFLCLLFITQDFYFGGRISSLQLLFALFYFYSAKFSLFHLLFFVFFGYFLFDYIQFYRSFYLTPFEYIFSLFQNQPDNYIKISTFGDVLYSSSALVMGRDSLYSSYDILSFSTEFVISIFIGGSVDSNIISFISTDVSPLGGGGFFPVYLYFWFGFFGVFLSSLFVSFLLNYFSINKHNNSMYFYVTKILFISLLPRWFYYSPLNLFRYIFVNFTVFYFFLLLFHLVTKKKNIIKSTSTIV